LAFTAILGTSSARAQNPGDLILGFEEPGSGGSSNVYEVDLGAISQFSSSKTFDLSASDLSTEFGNSWASSSLLQFGVVGSTLSSGSLTLGSNTLAAKTVFTSWNTFAAAPVEKSSQATEVSDVNALYNDVANVGTPTTGSTVSLPAVSTTTSDAGSFATIDKNNQQFGFGTGFAKSNLDYNSDGTTSAVDTATLDLYEVAQTSSGTAPGSLLGTLSLNSSGDLAFTAAAVPEPSSWALMGVGVLGLFWNLRRRSLKGAAV